MRLVLKSFFACCFSVLMCMEVYATQPGSVSYKKLDDRVSVVFVDTYSTDSLLIMMCVSAGVADEIEHQGVANLLCDVLLRKLKQQADADNLPYGAQSSAYTGYDQSVYYFYGKPENLEGFIKNFSLVTQDFSCTAEQLAKSKKSIEQTIKDHAKIDKFNMQRDVRRSLYWHAGYGNNSLGELADLEVITPGRLVSFYNDYYRKSKITFVILGRTNHNQVTNSVQKYFGAEKWSEKFVEQNRRLEEPPHHGSTVHITRESTQTDVVVMNFYWKITSYKEDKNKALADEIFIMHLEKAMQQQLVEQQKLISSMSINYTNWNKEYGDFCVTVTVDPSADLEFIKLAVVASMKCLASEGITKAQVATAVKRVVANANFYKMDAMDAVDWISKRISAGYTWDDLKNYAKFAEKTDCEFVNKEVKKLFSKEPDVISIIKPKDEKYAI